MVVRPSGFHRGSGGDRHDRLCRSSYRLSDGVALENVQSQYINL